MSDPWATLQFEAGKVFTPGSPISERALFSGRLEQIGKIIDTISKTGYHAVLYGERGVGKTSLSNVLESFVQNVGESFRFPRVNCDTRDTFASMWKKLFAEITVTETRPGVGFTSSEVKIDRQLVDSLPTNLTPDLVRRTVSQLSRGIILVPIFDEFDRVNNLYASSLMADTIKSLSDYGVKATILVIGVAESVDGLIKEHQSIERTLVQIPMPRMSREEIRQIIENGLKELKLDIEDEEARAIVDLAQGLPYIAHLLSLHATQSAIQRKSKTIRREDVQKGITIALDDWQQSIKTAYYNATRSPQPGNIFREVVLACAFAEHDELGYFAAASVREPLNTIVPSRSYDIPNYARHLKQLSQPERGSLLSRTGEKRRLRYRFNSPLMIPFIVMKGISDKIISREQLPVLMSDYRRIDGPRAQCGDALTVLKNHGSARSLPG